jgi:hypothetical protein
VVGKLVPLPLVVVVVAGVGDPDENGPEQAVRRRVSNMIRIEIIYTLL